MKSTTKLHLNYLDKVKDGIQELLSEDFSSSDIRLSEDMINETGSCFHSANLCVLECWCSSNCPEGCSTGCSSGSCHSGMK